MYRSGSVFTSPCNGGERECFKLEVRCAEYVSLSSLYSHTPPRPPVIVAGDHFTRNGPIQVVFFLTAEVITILHFVLQWRTSFGLPKGKLLCVLRARGCMRAKAFVGQPPSFISPFLSPLFSSFPPSFLPPSIPYLPLNI